MSGAAFSICLRLQSAPTALAFLLKEKGKGIMKTGKFYILALSTAMVALTGCEKDADRDGTSIKTEIKVDGKTEGQVIDDENLTKMVNRSLKESEAFKFPDVNVTTHKGEVQLSGFVANREQKDAAGDIAKKVAGVRNVDNKIEVKK